MRTHIIRCLTIRYNYGSIGKQRINGKKRVILPHQFRLTQYCKDEFRQSLLEKAKFFYYKSNEQLMKFETKNLTRPIVLLMQNGFMFGYFINIKNELSCNIVSIDLLHKPTNIISLIMRNISKFSLKNEFQFIKWRFTSRMK